MESLKTNELKPCPFCGKGDQGVGIADDCGDSFSVMCDCGAETDYHESRDEAVNHWNKRDNDRLVKENAELREHLENLVDESIALAQFKNDTLRKNICSTDLDDPEWHDYQTIGEAGAYLENLLAKHK